MIQVRKISPDVGRNFAGIGSLMECHNLFTASYWQKSILILPGFPSLLQDGVAHRITPFIFITLYVMVCIQGALFDYLYEILAILEVIYDSAKDFTAAAFAIFDFAGGAFANRYGICWIYLCPQHLAVPMA